MIDDDTAMGVIDEKGSIIGEMAILLNDKRTADLVATEDTTLVSIKRDEIRDLFKSEQEIFMSTLVNLSMREAYNCNYIQQLYDIVTKDNGERERYLEEETRKYREEITLLKEKVEEAKHNHSDCEWMSEVCDKFKSKLDQAKI